MQDINRVKQTERKNEFLRIKIILQNLCSSDQLHLSVHLQLLTNCLTYLVYLVLQVSCEATTVESLSTL